MKKKIKIKIMKKNKYASNLAKLRWSRISKEERSRLGRETVMKRWAKRATVAIILLLSLTVNLMPYKITVQNPVNLVKIIQPKIVYAEVTAYNPVKSQTDSTPTINAANKKVKEGDIACPLYLKFGQKVEIEGRKFTCNDRMAKKYRDSHYFDILMLDYKSALEFGRQELAVRIY